MDQSAVADHHGSTAETRGDAPECRSADSCACGCALASPERTVPAKVEIATVPIAPDFLAILGPVPAPLVSFAEIKQPGFFGYDSGPPVQSLCLPHQSRAPPAPRA